MSYITRRPTEPRFIVRWFCDDPDDHDSGGEYRVIDSDRQEVMASYGSAGANNESTENQRHAAIMHARSLNG